MGAREAEQERGRRRSNGGDVVIVGAGLAGLFTALKLAPMPVTVIAAAPLGEGATSAWAQAGIAAAVGEGDTAAAHMTDTIKAGAGIVDEIVAGLTAGDAARRIADLSRLGVPFDRDSDGRYVLSREAAHSASRVVRVTGDSAGAAIMSALIGAVREAPSIRVMEGFEARALATCTGAVSGLVLKKNLGNKSGALYCLGARAVVLATGGIGYLYAITTNPPFARGDAIAMAAKAGAAIADAEFVQFHPTAIDAGLDPVPLATESLRGEGAVLINSDGNRFMQGLHPDAELAPRDIVARAVFREIRAGRGAFLDCRQAVGARFADAFPTVYGHCQAAGIDPASQPIPIAPAVHYHMGGIATDGRGRANVEGLWACGEATSTGLHGANRLASNSLLEAVVFGARVAEDIAGHVTGSAHSAVDLERGGEGAPLQAGVRRRLVTTLRQTMQTGVGVERDAKGLADTIRTLDNLGQQAGDDAALANMVLAARFVATAALKREESRGGHFRTDFPEPRPALAERRFMTLADGGRIVCAPAHRSKPFRQAVTP